MPTKRITAGRAARGCAPAASSAAPPAAECKKIFGHWKRNLGYDRVRYVGWARNRLELELKCLAWNLRRWVTVSPA